MGRTIGIYGGTFDPFHLGHLALAVAVREGAGLDEVWLVPSSCNPLKGSHRPISSFAQRLAMVEAVANEVPGFETCDIEGETEGPSYTVNTVVSLLVRYPEDRFYLILGEDAAASLSRWHRSEELVAKVELLVGSRGADVDWSAVRQHPLLWAAICKGRCTTPLMEVSATEIRERLRAGLYCGHLLPGIVYDVIKAEGLYGMEM